MRFYLRLAWDASPGLFAGSAGLILICSAVPLANIYFSARLMSEAVGQLAGSSTPGDAGGLILIAAAWGGVVVLGSVFEFFKSRTQKLHQDLTIHHVQRILSAHAASLDLEFFENPEFHAQLQQATNEAGTRPVMIVRQIMQLASTGVTAAGLIAMVVGWKPWLVLLILAVAVLRLLLSARSSAERYELQSVKVEGERRAQYFRTMLTSDWVAKELRLYRLKDYFLERFTGVWRKNHETEKAFMRRAFWREGVWAPVLSVDRPLLVGYIAYQCFTRQISVLQFGLYSQAYVALQGAARSWGETLAQIQEARVFGESLRAFLALRPKVERPDRTAVLRAAGHPAPALIEFRHVTFRYPGTAVDVLQDVSFSMKAGEVIALVGRNGAGKTTLIKLLPGLYHVDAGTIAIDGRDIRDFTSEELRGMFSVIAQDFQVYNLSIAENISIGDVREAPDPARIRQVAAEVGLDRMVETLPEKYDTLIGRHLTRGLELSGGQRQMLALARARYRNANVLVMDEPSAALDAFAEEEVFRRVFRADRSGHTLAFLISHRLTAIKHADKILVLDGARLVESGDHTTLMALNGKYAEMFAAQSRLFERDMAQVG